MDGPAVSVVVPVYNGERFLARALESALAQDYNPLEIVVVDDGSTDGSAAIAASLPVTLISQPNAGVAAARNAGVAASSGEFVAFLDQDDIWRAGKVSRQAEALVAGPDLGFVLARMQIVLEPGTARPPWLHESSLEQPSPASIPSALMVRRSAFEAVGGFDRGYRLTSDADWLARAKDAGVPWQMVDETLLEWRIHDANGVHERPAMLRELAVVLQRSLSRQRRAAA